MAVRRMAVGVAVLDGKLYAVGGYGENDDLLSLVERYDPATNAWEPVATTASARDEFALAVLDGKLYAVGGQSDVGLLSSVERYDPALNALEAMAPMGTGRIGSIALV